MCVFVHMCARVCICMRARSHARASTHAHTLRHTHIKRARAHALARIHRCRAERGVRVSGTEVLVYFANSELPSSDSLGGDGAKGAGGGGGGGKKRAVTSQVLPSNTQRYDIPRTLNTEHENPNPKHST